jgi:hypothetical protein
MDSNYCGDFLWQSNGKTGKFLCIVWQLHVLRELNILVSLSSFLLLVIVIVEKNPGRTHFT